MRAAAVLFALLMSSVACRPSSSKDSVLRGVELSLIEPLYVEDGNLEQQTEEQFTRSSGIAVRSFVGNQNTGGLLAQQLELLQSGAPVPDVCYLDNVWAGGLDRYLLDITPYIPKSLLASYIPEVLKAYQVDGKLIGLPRDTGFPLLYYRTDLLYKYGFSEPPETWDQLEQMAFTIQKGERRRGNSDFWGFVWEGAPTETLTCVAQELQISSGGGPMLGPDGTVSVNNPRAAKAFARAARWIHLISPPGTTAYNEEDVRNVWEAGNAAFARNWTHLYGASQAPDSLVRGKLGVVVLPHDPGASSASTIGGWGIGISKFSRHPREAARFVQALTSRALQARRFERTLMLPALNELYSDPAIKETALFLRPIKDKLFRSAVARPSAIAGAHYTEVSHAYALGIHSILTRQATAPEALAALEKEMVRIMQVNAAAPAVHGI